jgi:hypothetical protein
MRMGKKLACVITSLLLYASPAVAEVSGNDWRQYDEHTKATYLAGVIDTWSRISRNAIETPPMTDDWLYYRRTTDDLYGRLANCAILKNMTYEQLSAIANKYLNAHSEEWSYAMTSLFWFAMRDVCKKPL